MAYNLRVTFDRVGRHHPEPFTFEDVSEGQELAALIFQRIRPLLMSNVIDVEIFENLTGQIYTGGRPAGSFKVEQIA